MISISIKIIVIIIFSIIVQPYDALSCFIIHIDPFAVQKQVCSVDIYQPLQPERKQKIFDPLITAELHSLTKTENHVGAKCCKSEITGVTDPLHQN